MYPKRSTPKTKNNLSMSSRFRSPNLNSTIASTTSRNSVFDPNFSILDRKTLSTKFNPSVDSELECDFSYSEYLQSLIKKNIAEKTIQKHDKEIRDQLVIQKDNLDKGKLRLQKINHEIFEIHKINEVDQLLTEMKDIFPKLIEFVDDTNLKNTLEQLLGLINKICKQLKVENVKIFDKEEDWDKFKALLTKCVETHQKMNLNGRNVNQIRALAQELKILQEQTATFAGKQEFIKKLQADEMLKLFKGLSDMYAANKSL